jgi:hypothetical protein
MKLESIEIRVGFIRREEPIEGCRIMRIEIVHHNPDAIRIRVVDVCNFDHPIDPLAGSPFLGDLDVDPPSQRFGSEMKVLLAVAFVVGIDTGDRSRFRRERVAFVAAKRLAGLVETDDRAVLVVWFVVEIKHVLHVIDELAVVFSGNLPIVVEVRFQRVFLTAV